MEAVLIYSFKVAVCLGVLYGFYFLALRHLTFYNWNRWFLLLGSLACCAIPVLATLSWFQSSPTPYGPVLKIIPRLYTFATPGSPAAANPDFYSDFLNFWLPLLFIFGVLVQGARLGMQFWSFYRLRQHAQRLPGYAEKVYQIDQNLAPFSFGQSIFLNSDLLQLADLPEIIRHELVHVQQAHTVDIIWMEIVCLLNWYNPFAWLLRQQLRQNLEFIADHHVLQSGTDKKHYQYLFPQVIGQPDFRLANQFNFSPLKKRIMMMNKMPSSKRELAKFLLIFPVMAVLLLACQEELPVSETSKNEALQEVAPPQLPPVPAKPDPQTENYSDADFLKRNPTVFYITPIFRNNNFKSVEVALRSGKKEIYNLDDKTELAQFREKYGDYPVNVKNLPPPPPPVVREFAMPYIDMDPLPADYKAFLKRHPQVKTIGWDEDGAVIIMANSGRAEDDEVYDLNDPTLKAMLDKKYGELPQKPYLK